jgi:hypothetical protein
MADSLGDKCLSDIDSNWMNEGCEDAELCGNVFLAWFAGM